jgi:hypothetical protein
MTTNVQLIIFLLAAVPFAIDYMVSNNSKTTYRGLLWNKARSEKKATTPVRMNLLVDGINDNRIKEKPSVVIKLGHLFDSSILIPDYPNQTDVSVVEQDIFLSQKSSNSSSNTGEQKGSPLALCNPTAQVHVSFSQPHWTLTTFDKHGHKKNIGGDEFYIVYRDNSWNGKTTDEDPTAIALIQDHENGTYTLDFVTIPTFRPKSSFAMGLGNLTVYFEYTCGIGSMAPPSKQHWNNKGSTSAVFTHTNVPQPRIRPFQHPPKAVNMSDFDFVNFIGASTMRNLVENCNIEKWRHRIHLQQDFQSPLNTSTVDAFIRTIDRPETLLQRGNRSNNKRIALVLGSDVWDVLSDDPNQGPGFEDHLLACARAVELSRELYPNVTVLWK